MNQYNADGQEHGPWEGHRLNCKLWWRGNYVNGQRHGEWEQYHKNGQLMLKRNFVNDKLHGPYESYHENGQPCNKGFYHNHQRIGFWLYLNTNSTILKQFYL